MDLAVHGPALRCHRTAVAAALFILAGAACAQSDDAEGPESEPETLETPTIRVKSPLRRRRIPT